MVLPQDVALDWTNGGLTKQAYDFAKPAIKGGLSSRWVLGETGPMYGVKDALTLDRKLIPLWQKIAAAADEQVESSSPSSNEDMHANPWTTSRPKPSFSRVPDLEANPFRH